MEVTSKSTMSRIILPEEFPMVDVQVECPVCADFLIGVIKMCTRGHSLCCKCGEVVQSCPLCRKEMSQVRNYFMEYFMDCCTFKCKYHDQGCLLEVRPSNYYTHTASCHFREVSCNKVTCDGCEAVVNFKDYIPHVKLRHDIREFDNGKDYCFKFPKKLGKLFQSPYAIIEFDGKVFFYNFATFQMKSTSEKEVTIAVWWVSCINLENDIKKYNAEIQIASSKDKKLRMTWFGPVHDFRLTAEEVMIEKQCLSSSLPALKQFCSDDEKDPDFYFSYIENVKVSLDEQDDNNSYNSSDFYYEPIKPIILKDAETLK